jgi:hypothetical protein
MMAGGLLVFAQQRRWIGASGRRPSTVAATGHAVARLRSAEPCRPGKGIGDGMEAC